MPDAPGPTPDAPEKDLTKLLRGVDELRAMLAGMPDAIVQALRMATETELARLRERVEGEPWPAPDHQEDAQRPAEPTAGAPDEVLVTGAQRRKGGAAVAAATAREKMVSIGLQLDPPSMIPLVCTVPLQHPTRVSFQPGSVGRIVSLMLDPALADGTVKEILIDGANALPKPVPAQTIAQTLSQMNLRIPNAGATITVVIKAT